MSDIISYERDTAVGNLTHEFLLSMASHDLSVFYCVTDITVTTKATYLFTVTISSLCFIHIQLCVCVFFQKVCVDIKQEVLAPSGEAILLILTPPAEFLQMGLCSSSVPVESQHAVFLWNFFLCSTTKKTLNNTFLHSSYSTVYEWMIHESFIVMFMCLNHILKSKKFLTVLNALLWANL